VHLVLERREAGRDHQLAARFRIQTESVGQERQRVQAGCSTQTTLEVGHTAHADARSVRQRLVREPGRDAVAAQGLQMFARRASWSPYRSGSLAALVDVRRGPQGWTSSENAAPALSVAS